MKFIVQPWPFSAFHACRSCCCCCCCTISNVTVLCPQQRLTLLTSGEQRVACGKRQLFVLINIDNPKRSYPAASCCYPLLPPAGAFCLTVNFKLNLWLWDPLGPRAVAQHCQPATGFMYLCLFPFYDMHWRLFL